MSSSGHNKASTNFTAAAVRCTGPALPAADHGVGRSSEEPSLPQGGMVFVFSCITVSPPGSSASSKAFKPVSTQIVLENLQNTEQNKAQDMGKGPDDMSYHLMTRERRRSKQNHRVHLGIDKATNFINKKGSYCNNLLLLLQLSLDMSEVMQAFFMPLCIKSL